MYFDYAGVSFRYNPFPVALVRPVLAADIYERFVDEFPPLDLFESFEAMGKRGRKYTLSEKESPRRYLQFVLANPFWARFHAWIKSDAFVYETLDMLKSHGVDLGYRHVPRRVRLTRAVKSLMRARPAPRHVPLRARFEFSALPADGGQLPPHTDAPTKIVTMVLSIVREGEWDAAPGGGTDMNWPKDETRTFNHVNRVAGFDEVEVLDTYPFEPNQLLVFVKTFNSWHSVAPMRGPGSRALRRTLTINIEALR